MSADVCQKCHCQMVYDGVCEYCGDGYDANRTRELQAENARLLSELAKMKELLAEAKEWLCPHAEAVTTLQKRNAGRVWCLECHNYIRSMSDITLIERISSLVGEGK